MQCWHNENDNDSYDDNHYHDNISNGKSVINNITISDNYDHNNINEICNSQ